MTTIEMAMRTPIADPAASSNQPNPLDAGAVHASPSRAKHPDGDNGTLNVVAGAHHRTAGLLVNSRTVISFRYPAEGSSALQAMARA